MRWEVQIRGNRYFDGFMDILRVSAVNAFPDGTSFANHFLIMVQNFSATGSFENNAITAPLQFHRWEQYHLRKYKRKNN